ncbi:GNAT family N-acetyltransferase [Clostridium fungisolvens]|uniref:N-acetyltransferase domain-containing protein n=1 Tax=Clostridium fungisolvens TaxID=1604897 RepID=A0A6V8SFR4_9CLOT|nr:GNAT family N-acetyltransferase [Clostridium fungisolvens]GFP76064.1 hypothetical protein bsdtw1_02158 [Clostridium fungisolvens]
MEYEIKIAHINNLYDIVELLNTVTLNLHKKNINQWQYPWDTEEIKSNIENKYTYAVFNNEKIIGTFSLKPKPKSSWIPEIDEEILYLHTLAILPEYQKKSIGCKIIDFSHNQSATLNKPLYLDCWSKNIKLKTFYLNSGFDYLMDYPEEDFEISVFKYHKI